MISPDSERNRKIQEEAAMRRSGRSAADGKKQGGMVR